MDLSPLLFRVLRFEVGNYAVNLFVGLIFDCYVRGIVVFQDELFAFSPQWIYYTNYTGFNISRTR